MKSYSLSELNRRPGELVDDALRAPVFLVKRSRPHLVLLSVDDFEKLTGKTVADMVARPDEPPKKRRDFSKLPSSMD